MGPYVDDPGWNGLWFLSVWQQDYWPTDKRLSHTGTSGLPWLRDEIQPSAGSVGTTRPGQAGDACGPGATKRFLKCRPAKVFHSPTHCSEVSHGSILPISNIGIACDMAATGYRRVPAPAGVHSGHCSHPARPSAAGCHTAATRRSRHDAPGWGYAAAVGDGPGDERAATSGRRQHAGNPTAQHERLR